MKIDAAPAEITQPVLSTEVDTRVPDASSSSHQQEEAVNTNYGQQQVPTFAGMAQESEPAGFEDQSHQAAFNDQGFPATVGIKEDG